MSYWFKLVGRNADIALYCGYNNIIKKNNYTILILFSNYPRCPVHNARFVINIGYLFILFLLGIIIPKVPIVELETTIDIFIRSSVFKNGLFFGIGFIIWQHLIGSILMNSRKTSVTPITFRTFVNGKKVRTAVKLVTTEFPVILYNKNR